MPGLRPATALLMVAGVASALGCVSATEYRRTVDDRDALRARNAAQAEKIVRLEAEERNLSDELAKNYERFEDLRIEHEALEKAAKELRNSRATLQTRLKAETEQAALIRSELEETKSEVGRLASTYTTLMADLESEVSSGQIEIEQLREGIRVSVSDDIIFASGSAELDPVGKQVLDKVSQELLALDHSIEVQGHTDDRGLKASLAERFPTNWELAAARSARVVRLMQEHGIPGERLRVVSFASFQPLAPNDSPENRAQNRRIEIRLRPGTAQSDGSSVTSDEEGGGQ